MRVVALLSVAASSVAAAAPSPVMWSFVGLPFPAPAMIAGMFGCSVTRVIVGQADKTSRWFVRVPIDILTLGTTFAVIVERQPDLFAGLLTGIFVGTLGATIIKIAEKWGGRFLSVVMPETPAAPPAPPAPPAT